MEFARNQRYPRPQRNRRPRGALLSHGQDSNLGHIADEQPVRGRVLRGNQARPRGIPGRHMNRRGPRSPRTVENAGEPERTGNQERNPTQRNKNFTLEQRVLGSAGLQAPVFTTVGALATDEMGVCLKCVVVGTPELYRTIENVKGQEINTWEVLLGDQTGCVLGWFLGGQEDALSEGVSLEIRNAKTVMNNEVSMRLLVTKWAKVRQLEDLDMEIKTENNVS